MISPRRLQAGYTHPKGFVRDCLLLLLAEEPTHGYQLHERAKAFVPDLGDPQSVYRALHCLSESALVRPHWETGGPGPARRIHEISPAGRRELRARAASLHELSDRLVDYLLRCRALGQRTELRHGQSHEVQVEGTMTVHARDQQSAERKVEEALAKPCRCGAGVWFAPLPAQAASDC